jgi:acetyl esterase/lipase
VGDQDIFLDESIEFVNRLKDAKVPVEMHVYPGAYHASEIIAPSAELSQRIWARRISALQKALA